MKKIMEGNNPGSFTVGGVKYMVLGSEDPSSKLRGKCRGGGCTICKTNQTLVVGIWAEPVTPATCDKVRSHACLNAGQENEGCINGKVVFQLLVLC